MTVFINIFSTCCLGDSKYCSEKVSEIINKRLGTGWNDALPPPFKQTTIFFLSGEPVGPDENTDHCKDLSVNWCLGDSSIEILDSITGYAINKSVILNKQVNDSLPLWPYSYLCIVFEELICNQATSRQSPDAKSSLIFCRYLYF